MSQFLSSFAFALTESLGFKGRNHAGETRVGLAMPQDEALPCVFPGNGNASAYGRGATGHESLVERLRLFAGRIAELEEERRALVDENARLTGLATVDGLTELCNYRHFRERLEGAVSSARRYRNPLSVVMIDVDHFKAYNDAFGHQRGDEALVAVASILRATARKIDTVARYGGEEFAALLPSADVTGSVALAERIRSAVEGHHWPLRPVTVSIGVQTMPVNAGDSSGLLEEAERALYASKGAGRNHVTHFRDLARPPAGRRPTPLHLVAALGHDASRPLDEDDRDAGESPYSS